MRNRRGISEVVSAVILMGVVAAASFHAVSGSASKITDQRMSVADVLEREGIRVQELIAVISKNVSDGLITLEFVNYGERNVVINEVFVDGEQVPAFEVLRSDGTLSQENKLEPRQITALRLAGSGQSIQILTDSENLINIPL